MRRSPAPTRSVTASQTVEPLTGYTVLRARREFANQSNDRLHADVDEPPDRCRRSTSWPTTRIPAASTTTCGCRRSTTSRGYCAGSHIAGQHRGDHAAAGEQRPRVPAARRRLRRASTRRRRRCTGTPARSLRQDRRREDALQLLLRLQDARLRHQRPRVSCAAPTSGTQQLVPVRDNFSRARFMRTCNFNLNQWAGWNFGGDRPIQRRQRQHRTGRGRTTTASAAAEPRTPRRSAIA